MAIENFIESDTKKSFLRISTAGSVDDGKSTMIGRLLFDSKKLYKDHLASLQRDSLKRGGAGNAIDFALLLDGLKIEREQNITIDVAYRYFSTPRRKFIVADTPGHEQYTRNMVTGASTADLAIILIDAQKGLTTQSKRHSFIMSLLGVRHLVVAVNKMDLVDYSEEVFESIKAEFSGFISRLELYDITFIPISALYGDNIVTVSKNMSWYRGVALLYFLETVNITSDRNLIDLRFPVQYVLRPHMGFRGYCGTVVSGVVRQGDEVMILPSGHRSRIQSIVTYDGELGEAFPPMAVTLTLHDELDIGRGDMLVHSQNIPFISDTIEAMVVWMSETPLEKGKKYLIKHVMNVYRGELMKIRYSVNINTLHRVTTDTLKLNEVGRIVFNLNKPMLFDMYKQNRSTGSFIIIDIVSNVTVGAGMIIIRSPHEFMTLKKHESARQKSPADHHKSMISKKQRRERLNQRPATICLTGQSRSRISKIAYLLEKKLFELGYFVHVLDSDHVKLSLSSDLGESVSDKAENIRRIAEVAKICYDNGLITIVSVVSSHADIQRKIKDLSKGYRFFKIDTDTLHEESTHDHAGDSTHQSSYQKAVDILIQKLQKRKILLYSSAETVPNEGN